MFTPSKTSHAFLPLKAYATSIPKALLVVMGGVVFVGLGAHLDVPMIPVPMSMQTYAVLVIGALAGWRLGGLIILAYIAAAAAGAPLFAGGASGLDHLSGATAGYIYGFVISASLVGFLAEKGWTLRFFQGTLAMLLGHIIILLLGTLWLSWSIGMASAVKNGLSPFLVGALAKSLLGAGTLVVLLRFKKT